MTPQLLSIERNDKEGKTTVEISDALPWAIWLAAVKVLWLLHGLGLW